MKIALVTAKHCFDNSYDKYANTRKFENIGVESIAAVLRKNGFSVDLYNQSLQNLSNGKLLRALKNEGYNLIGFSTISSNAQATLALVKALPRQIHKCLGGYAATFFPEELLKEKGVDSVIRGEGEIPFLELALAIKNGADYHSIKNLGTKKELNPLRGLIDLDTLPTPSRDELKRLLNRLPKNAPRLALLSSSRGCYNKCSFCYAQRFYSLAEGKKVRYRDPEKIVDEIEELVNGEYKIDYIWFTDEDFIGRNPERVKVFAEEIIKRKLKFKFEIDCRSDAVDYGLFALLKEAGLATVFIGVESFSQTVLNRWNKGLKTEDNIRAITVLEKLGIRYLLGCIFFDEKTSLEELQENLNFCKQYGFNNQNDPVRALKKYYDIYKVSLCIPEDKTIKAIYKKVKRKTNTLFATLNRLKIVFPLECLCGKLDRAKTISGNYLYYLVFKEMKNRK